MKFRKTEHVFTRLQESFSGIVSLDLERLQPFILIESESLKVVCKWLFEDEDLFFDFLNCITAVDLGIEKGLIELWYHFTSIPYEHSLILKTVVPRNVGEEVSTVSDIWRSADWHEREIYDLFGIKFKGHPDLRRILLPADWEGYPLRKDYEEAHTYHDIKVKY